MVRRQVYCGLLCLLATAVAQRGYPAGRPPLQQVFNPLGRPVVDNQVYGDEIPGEAGIDYPVFATVPPTTFRCDQFPFPGYYADQQAFCQAFYICQSGGRGTGFLCPNGTLFNQEFLVCDWWYNVDCARAPDYYAVNEAVVRAMEAADASRLGRVVRPDGVYVNARGEPISSVRAPGGRPVNYSPLVGGFGLAPNGTARPGIGFQNLLNNYRQPFPVNPYRYRPQYAGPVNARYPYSPNINPLTARYPYTPQYPLPLSAYNPQFGPALDNRYRYSPQLLDTRNRSPYRSYTYRKPSGNSRPGNRNNGAGGNGDDDERSRENNNGGSGGNNGRRYQNGGNYNQDGRPDQKGRGNNRQRGDDESIRGGDERYRDRGSDEGYFYDRPRNELRGGGQRFGDADPEKAYLPPEK